VTVLTVRELLRDLDVRLCCGEAVLDAPVRWVHISELLDPTPWLSGGELLLTTGLQLDTAKRERDFVARLAEHQLAGLGLGTGFAHDTVPMTMIEAAEERDFPLFEVPYEVPFIAITEKAFTRLVNEQYAVLQRSIAAHERLERIVLSERGLEAVVTALATLVGGAALVFDARGQLLAQRRFRRPLADEVVESLCHELGSRARTGHRRGFAPAHPELAERALALPVPATGAPIRDGAPPQAWLVAVKDSGGLTEFDRLTLHQAVTIIALELLRHRVAEDTERRLAGDVLSDMVSGELSGVELARRLEPFGIRERAAALVLAPAGLNGGPGVAVAACETALAGALREEAAGGLVASAGAYVCALLPDGDEDDLFGLAERVAERIRTELDTAVSVGAGRAVPAGDARRSFHEARCALEARALAGNGNGAGAPTEVATYRDLGSFQLLLSLQDEQALRLFCDSILGPIENGEGHYGGELMRSLEAFIECNGQWERAARRLYCHRHTLRYRIRKVEELTGRDLASARDRIEFWLALRGRELVP
jgi:DNA-binding PucR family transcriptional regulator